MLKIAKKSMANVIKPKDGSVNVVVQPSTEALVKSSDTSIPVLSITPAEALHIIALYMKGQKVLYMEAKSHCERRLNMLMLPAIINSAVCTVISSALREWQYGTVLFATLSAFNSCVLAIISYLKLDAKCEAHRASAFQFERLQNLCEFHAGKFLFGVSSKDGNEFGEIILEIETKMKEIKDSNQFMLPKTIRHMYSLIYTTNVFSAIRATPTRIHALEDGFKNEMIQQYEPWYKKCCVTAKVVPELES